MTTQNISESRENLKVILRKYLNTIVYIDDKFGLSLAGEAPERDDIQIPSRSRRRVIKSDIESAEVDTNIEIDSLSLLIEKMQRTYPQIKLLPVKYSGVEDKPYIEASIKSSRLIVIDWQLSDLREPGISYTAADVLSATEYSDQMKLLVIYTSDAEGAKNDFIKKEIITKFIDEEYNGKKFVYGLKNHSIVLICKKSDFDAGSLLEAYLETLLKYFGFFPIAFFDMLLKLEEKTGYLLNKFSHPFDSILLMQMESSGVQYNDNTELIRNLVTNNVHEEIQCDFSIVENLYEHRIHKLIDLSQIADEKLQDKLTKAKIIMQARSDKENKKVFELLGQFPVADMKQWLSEIDPSPSNWSNSLNSFCSKMVEKALCFNRQEIESKWWNDFDLKAKRKELQSKTPSIKKEIEEGILKTKNEIVKNTLKKAASLFLMLISDETVDVSISHLLSALQMNHYQNRKTPSEIALSIEHDEIGRIKETCVCKLENKFFQGDILYKKKSDGSLEFLICILPACQLFRPQKVDYIVSYIKGEVQNNYNDKFKKDSEHISIIPHPENEDQVICVKWKFHEMIQFDLKTSDKNSFAEYLRPYRLSERYFQQITSEFTNFYSKIGVEDLFIKQSPEIAGFFLGSFSRK